VPKNIVNFDLHVNQSLKAFLNLHFFLNFIDLILFTMAANMSVGWETVGGAGKPIKKVGSEKQVAKKEAEAKKKFVEKGPRMEDVRKLTWFFPAGLFFTILYTICLNPIGQCSIWLEGFVL
jgi:hypothetical protein